MTNATERAPFAEWLAGLTDHDKEDFLRQWYEAECAPREAQPDGWKLVPVEPTDAMLEEITLIKGFTERAMVVRYKAMLDAAPTPERADADAAWEEQRKKAAKALVETYLGFPAPDREPCELDLKAVDAVRAILAAGASERADAEKDAALMQFEDAIKSVVPTRDRARVMHYARTILAANTEKQS
jgi:hypothetical protein